MYGDHFLSTVQRGKTSYMSLSMTHRLSYVYLVLLQVGLNSGVTKKVHATVAENLGRLIRRVRETGTECPKIFSDIDPNHSMCLKDIGIDVPLTDKEKEHIVNLHNELRSGVSPTAANMQKMVWDEDLAEVASKWSRQCIVGHESEFIQRSVPSLPDVSIGQNVGGGYQNISKCIENGWYGEVADYKYGNGSINGKTVGHYTQVVNSAAARIGCGIADCNNVPDSYGIYYVCDYARLQYGTEVPKPYTEGKSCDACPDHCHNNLCDCQGKICYYGGRLDLASCNCSCWDLYIGDSCEIVNCPDKDPDYCANKGADYCTKWADSVSNCPYMCDACPVDQTCTLQCQNSGTLDESACTCSCSPGMTGELCEIKVQTCTLQCQNGGTLYESTCTCSCLPGMTGNSCEIKVQACTLQCQNGGTLDETACTCSCPPGMTGNSCEIKAQCTEPDRKFCRRFVFFHQRMCEFPQIRKRWCPRTCGRCGTSTVPLV